tara:strand:+ start:455 stop:682 length:228 start_codon:yes stop_codon:yes gene_type:complete
MKITKTQLKQIIREELGQEMENRSTKNQLALMVHKIKTALDPVNPNMESVKSFVNQLDEYIDKLPDDIKEELAKH